MNEIFLDTETTGLSFKEGHKIVEIACIETQDLIANYLNQAGVNPRADKKTQNEQVKNYVEQSLEVA